MQRVSIIGVGRVGGALALALNRQGYEIERLFVRNPETARKVSELIAPKPEILPFEAVRVISSDLVFITTQDSEIEGAGRALAGKIRHRKPFVFHTSGALSSTVLQPVSEAGCPTGSIHPLVSVSDPVFGAGRFAGAFCCVEGDALAVERAKSIVGDLGGKPFSIETERKILYHAAAVTACGHLVALIDTAIEMLSRCGLNEAAAKETLLPLIRSTVDNLEVQSPAAALTGTFARADVKTFEKHLVALAENVSAEALEIYLQLGARSAHLAQRQGASAENVKEILNKISLAKKNFRC